MSYPELTTERMELLAEIYANAQPAGTYYTGPTWFSMENSHKCLVILAVVSMAATSTLDLAILEAQDANGTGEKAITGKAITQLSAVLGDDHEVVFVNIRTEEMDANGGFTHLSVRTRVGTAASTYAVIVLGDIPRAAPVDVSRATEIVA